MGQRVHLLAGAVLIGLLVLAPSASGVETHAVQFMFDGTGSTAGAFEKPGALAIHQGTGDVFVIDSDRKVVDKFDSAGNPKNFSALGESSLDVDAECASFGSDEPIAVDSSGGPNDGNVYVGSPVCAYDAAGNFLWQSSENAVALAVDDSGRVWFTYVSGAYQFEETGSPPGIENILGNDKFPHSLALDSLGNFYFTDYYFPRITRYTLVGGLQEVIQNWDPNIPGHLPIVAVDPATDHLFVAGRPIGFKEYGVNASLLIGSFGQEDLNDNGGIAIDGATGNVFVSDSAADRVVVFSGMKDFPLVITGQPDNLGRHEAAVTGEIDPDGAGPVTSCHVEYGLTDSYGNSIPCNESLPITSPTEVTADIPGLETDTTYHYRMYASNASGSNRGKDQTFTTAFVSGVRTEPPTEVERQSATLQGTLDPEGIETSYYFQWGPTVGYGNTAPIDFPGESVGSAPGDTPVSAPIGGLQPNTTYHYRVVGVNAEGKTNGKDRAFTTDPPIKDLETETPSQVGPDTATLNGSLDPDGYGTTYYFEWGRTAAYGNTTPSLPGTDVGSTPGTTPVSAEIDGLDHYTSYHYRLVASNSFGTTYGEDVQFLSAPPFLPTVSDTAVLNITDDGATVSAKVTPGHGPTVFRFQYGTDTSYGNRTPLSEPIGDDDSPHTVSAEISNLQSGTTYHYRVVAINFSGSTLGPDRTFATAALPRIDAVSVSDVGESTARLRAQIGPNSSPTTYHFDYGTDLGYGSRTPESPSIGSDTGSHAVETIISGLAAGTTYHFRVVATNGIGTVPSGDQTFTTAAPPAVAPAPRPRCKRGFVRRRGKCVKRRRHRKKHAKKKSGKRKRSHSTGGRRNG
jgi:hypothetical protein